MFSSLEHFLKQTLKDSPNASTALRILHVYIFMQFYILNSVHFTTFTNALPSQLYEVLLLTHFTVEEISTEKLSNLPEITQLVGSRASESRQAGSRGHLAELPLRSHALCRMQRGRGLLPEMLSFSGSLLRPGVTVLLRNKIWHTELRNES